MESQENEESHVHQVSITSGESLKRRLSSAEVDIQELLNIFWKSSSDWNARGNVFAGLMCSAAGCHTLNYENFNMDDSNNIPSAEEANKVETEPPALDPNFLSRYSKFICQLFKMIPLDETGILFLRGIMKVVSWMIVNPWDSVRMMSACTGLKLLTFCMKISNSAVLESQDTSSDTNSSPNTSYVKKQFTSLKNNAEKEVFKKAVRDICVSVRILAFAEMIMWAHHDPHYLLGGDFPYSLQFGLHDKKECAIYALTAIEVLFKEDLSDSRQMALFVKVQDALRNYLGHEGGFAIKAMSILASAVRFIKKTPSSDAKNVIYLGVYNKYQAVAMDAAKYVFKVELEEDVSNPLVVLKKLFVFQMEAISEAGINSSEGLLMDSFYPVLKDFVTWEHWEWLLSSCEAEHAAVVVKLFHSYARKVTTNYCPPGRVRSADLSKKKDLLSAANDFTTFLARTWKKFCTMDKIRLNEKAMGVFTHSFTFVNASLPSNIAFDILKYLSKIVKVSCREVVLTGAWSTISRLYKLIPWDSASAIHLKSIFDSVKNGVVEEFLEILRHPTLMMGSSCEENKTRLLFVIKFIEPHDNFTSLWERCCEELDSQRENTNSDVSKMGKILQILHRILIRQCDVITASSETSSADCSDEAIDDQTPGDSQISVSVDLTSQLLSRGQYLQKQAVHFLQNSEPLKLLSFDILVDMVVCFGKHMAGHPTCMIISDSLNVDVEPQLVKAACDAARQGDCKDKDESERDKEESACCHVLKYVCQLFAVGMMDITKIGELLTLTGENEEHDLMIMSAVKEFADRYPGKHILVAAALVSGLHGVILETFKTLEVTGDWDAVWRTALARRAETEAYWLLMIDFQAVWKKQKIRRFVQVMMKDIAVRSDNDYLFSTTSVLSLAENTTAQTDAESGAGESTAAPESDFTLAFAERSMIPHSTPHPSVMLEEISEPSED